jgi:hypothetical protein
VESVGGGGWGSLGLIPLLDLIHEGIVLGVDLITERY